jgi:hypothetical protein
MDTSNDWRPASHEPVPAVMRMMRAHRRSIAAFGSTGETCNGNEDAESSARDERSVRAGPAERRKTVERTDRRR